jgi:hypothetical protein
MLFRKPFHSLVPCYALCWIIAGLCGQLNPTI